MGTKRRDAADPSRPLRDKESNRQRNRQVTDATQSGTRTLMKYGKTKQHLVGLLLGLLLLSTQAQALSVVCCDEFTAECQSCEQGLSEEEYCSSTPYASGCEKYGNNCCSAFTAECESCAAGLSEEEYCKRNPYVTGCEKYNCCLAYDAKCLSCAAGLSEEAYCKKNPSTSGCEKYNCLGVDTGWAGYRVTLVRASHRRARHGEQGMVALLAH